MDHVSPPRVWLFPVVAALFLSGTAFAQEVALPQSSPASPAELPSPSPTAAATVPPPQLIPPDVLPMPDASALPRTTPAIPTIQQLDEELKPKVISQAAEDYRKKIETRKLRNRVQNDPAVKAALAASEKARTDVERRALLARYFNLLFDKMVAIAPADLKTYLDERRREQLAPLPQPRVRPTPKPAPTATPKVATKIGVPSSAPPPPPELPIASPTPSTTHAKLP